MQQQLLPSEEGAEVVKPSIDSIVDAQARLEVSHAGSTNISDIDYRVRFKGQPESEDRWFSHRQIMRKGGLKAFWDYVEQHPELKIQKKG